MIWFAFLYYDIWLNSCTIWYIWFVKTVCTATIISHQCVLLYVRVLSLFVLIFKFYFEKLRFNFVCISVIINSLNGSKETIESDWKNTITYALYQKTDWKKHCQC